MPLAPAVDAFEALPDEPEPLPVDALLSLSLELAELELVPDAGEAVAEVLPVTLEVFAEPTPAAEADEVLGEAHSFPLQLLFPPKVRSMH